MAELPTSFAVLLRHLRDSAELTQEEFAERARVGVNTISGLERGLHQKCQVQTAAAVEEALTIMRDLGDRGNEAALLNEAGTLHRVRADMNQAIACHRQALHLAREIGSSHDEADALAGLGRCAVAASDTVGAQSSLRLALQIFRKLGAAEATDVAAELGSLTCP